MMWELPMAAGESGAISYSVPALVNTADFK
jgi:hypothetical protein